MSETKQTTEQVKAAFEVVCAVGSAIRDAGSIPSGTLYGVLMGKMDLIAYERIIDTLKGAGVIKEVNHMLTWIVD